MAEYTIDSDADVFSIDIEHPHPWICRDDDGDYWTVFRNLNSDIEVHKSEDNGITWILKKILANSDSIPVPSAEYSSDSYTKLLLHMNGTDGSTTFTDDGETGHTVTANGDAEIDTAQKQFGTASGLFSGTGYLSILDHADFDFGADNFTIDFYIKTTTIYSYLSNEHLQNAVKQIDYGLDTNKGLIA